MDEDIVNELRDWAQIIEGVQGKAKLVMLSGEMFTEAANEIEKLRKTIAGMEETIEELEAVACDIDHLANDLYHGLICGEPACFRYLDALELWKIRNLPEEELTVQEHYFVDHKRCDEL